MKTVLYKKERSASVSRSRVKSNSVIVMKTESLRKKRKTNLGVEINEMSRKVFKSNIFKIFYYKINS